MTKVVAPSALHGERTFHFVGTVPYRRRDRTETQLAVWQSTCVICGANFEVTTPLHATTPEESTTFGTITCKAHRLTPQQASRLSRAKPDQRPHEFELIKAAKLAAQR
jgi:hypothetical protein